MQPTEILMQEHRVIEQVLNCLEVIARQGETNGKVDWKSVEQAIDFFQHFADRCHHLKEEECLFVVLEQKGFSPEQGPTAVMRNEHKVGRQQIAGMKQAVADASNGAVLAIADFVTHAYAYVQMLREHIQKEDHCLFQMADQALSDQEQLQVLESFARVEHEKIGQSVHEKYLGIATELANRFGVKSCASAPSSCSNCCNGGGESSGLEIKLNH